MLECLLAPLLETVRPHFDLSKTRLETLAVLLVGLANGRTVTLSHLASQFPGDAQHGSNYHRLQRFFQFVQLELYRRAAGRANVEPQAAEASRARPYQLETGVARCERAGSGRRHCRSELPSSRH